MDKVFLLLITLRSIDIDIDSVPIYILLASSSHQPNCDLNLTIDSRVLLFLLFFSPQESLQNKVYVVSEPSEDILKNH